VDKIIRFDPALPCATTNGETLCNKPAKVGIAYPAAGGWMLQPICKSCATAMGRVYQVVFLDDELKPDKKESNNG